MSDYEEDEYEDDFHKTGTSVKMMSFKPTNQNIATQNFT